MITTRTTRPTLAIAVLVASVATGCGDDGVTATGSASASIGSFDTGSESSVTLTSASSSSSSGTSADTSGTTTDATSADTTTDATSTDTDGTTGEPATVGQSQGQLVNVGQQMSSGGYRMVFTLGQPSPLQSAHASANYRMQAGLVGANGSPP